MSGSLHEGAVIAVARDGAHRFAKQAVDAIRLIAGQGVEGDAHLGALVQHRSRIAADPTQPNLRQVHLIHAELFDELAAQGFVVAPGELGENVTTRDINLLGLPRGTLLHIGQDAMIEVTGLRNPCAQIDAFQSGLLKAVLGRAVDGALVRKAGVMAVVRRGGEIRPGDPIISKRPPMPHMPLEPV